jgi:nucleotide-binding universal stress UspA family protein
MIPLNRILATTDFSAESRKGIRTAFELAMHFGAALHLVHVVSPMPMIPGATAPTGFHVPSVLKELQDMARMSLENLVKEESLPGVEAELKTLTGDPAIEIVRFADDIEADIIVMASHGQTGWKRFMSGSVTEKVVRYAATPVLAINGPGDDGSRQDKESG